MMVLVNRNAERSQDSRRPETVAADPAADPVVLPATPAAHERGRARVMLYAVLFFGVIALNAALFVWGLWIARGALGAA